MTSALPPDITGIHDDDLYRAADALAKRLAGAGQDADAKVVTELVNRMIFDSLRVRGVYESVLEDAC